MIGLSVDFWFSYVCNGLFDVVRGCFRATHRAFVVPRIDVSRFKWFRVITRIGEMKSATEMRATCGADGTVRLWEAATLEEIDANGKAQ